MHGWLSADIGALITGLTNKAVMAALLTIGLAHVDAGVFVDEADRRMVLLRPNADEVADEEGDADEAGDDDADDGEFASPRAHSGAAAAAKEFTSMAQVTASPVFQALMRSNPIPLSMCGVPKERQFSFFDSYHTTGMDIPQKVDAVAAVTIGKDTTFRDFGQGAYRMRGLGIGAFASAAEGTARTSSWLVVRRSRLKRPCCSPALQASASTSSSSMRSQS